MTDTNGEIRTASHVQEMDDPYLAGLRKRGSWDDPQIINDKRIDHENPLVRAVAERLHGNESTHLHTEIPGVVCVYCALRTSRVLTWAAEVSGS